VTTLTASASGIGSEAMIGLTVGAALGGSSFGWTGHVGEVLIYSAQPSLSALATYANGGYWSL